MKSIVVVLIACLLLFLWPGCSASRKETGGQGLPSLRETFKKDFFIGTAVGPRQTGGVDTVSAKLIPTQFNAVTPENIMKAEIIHPEWNRYNFDPADSLVAYAVQINRVLYKRR